jgi:hypothetical protein
MGSFVLPPVRLIRRGFGSVLTTEVTPDTMGVLRDGRRIAAIGFAQGVSQLWKGCFP